MKAEVKTYKDVIIAAQTGKIEDARALMDAIYEAGIPADEERDFDFVMMTIEAAAEAA